VIERHIVYPLANLFATDHIHVGDNVRIDWDHNQDRLNFTREVKDLAGFLSANIGEFVEVPAL
jgi:hypothetical protein